MVGVATTIGQMSLLQPVILYRLSASYVVLLTAYQLLSAHQVLACC